MTTKKVKARARVRITVEFQDVGDRWGGECSIDQVLKQGAQSAVGMLRKHFHREIETGEIVLGTPHVEAIVVEEDR